jgi:hypothetical protein
LKRFVDGAGRVLARPRHRLRKLLFPDRLFRSLIEACDRVHPRFSGWHASCCMEVVGANKAPRTFRNQPLKGNIMNVHKHMEAIFVVALASVGLGAYALDSMPEAGASASAPVMREAAAPASQALVMCAPRAARRA